MRHKKIPIVAAIVAPTAMSLGTVHGLEHTTKIFGASVFVNLNDFDDARSAGGHSRGRGKALGKAAGR